MQLSDATDYPFPRIGPRVAAVNVIANQPPFYALELIRSVIARYH
jgi:hypothetical protein